MKIAVLAGGISTERDVSLISGSQIYKALKENGHQVILLDVFLGYEPEGEEKNLSADEIFGLDKDWSKSVGSIAETNPDIEKIKALRSDGSKSFFGPNVIRLCQEADVVFLGLHGESGENGKIQACFDLLGITYTGTDYLSSAIAMNKGITKDIFRGYDIPTPEGCRILRKRYEALTPDEIVSEYSLTFPNVVKACSGGSSIGVSIAKTKEDFGKALAEAFRYDDEVIIEEFIPGREFSVCVMEDRALPVIEIAPKSGFYDYKNKYQAGQTVETCPAELDEETTKRMQDIACRAFSALRLKSYARFDFRLDERTGKIYCLEGNTLPGMTPTSLIPQEAAAEGTSFRQLVETIANAALKK